jgi:multiple sugar transport system permease protein/raffinose/stachyose/melibiose transport system permease protein
MGERAARGGLQAMARMEIAVFLLPALVLFLGFTAYPVVRTFYNSLFEIRPNGAEIFVGLQNFASLLGSDVTFRRAVVNTLIWSCVEPFIDVGIGLLLALALYAKTPFARFFRVAWFTPVLISTVVVAIIWSWIYNYDWGALNLMLRAIGLDGWTRAWLGDPATALPALIIADSWKWVGFNMVVCLAALHSLPSEVLEAAELDDCGWWAKLVHVIVPLLRATLLNLLVLAFIGRMKVFDLVWVTTRGGPLWATETASTYTFKRAFEWRSFDLGYPSAIAVIWFLVVIAAVVGLTMLLRQREKLEF